MSILLEAPAKGKETLATGVARDIRERIGKRELATGDRLPTVLELAKQYGVSHITIRAAVRELSDSGLVQSRRGAGIFIAVGAGYPGGNRLGDTSPARAWESPARAKPDLATTDGRALADPPARGIRNAVLGVLAFVDEAGISTGNLATLPMRDMVCVMEREFTQFGGERAEYRSILGLDQSWIRPRTAVEQLIGEGADAIALVNVFDTSEYHREVLETCVEARIPFVYVSGQGTYSPCPHVYCDQKHAGYLVARHLISQGARRLTFLAPFTAQWLEERIEGAKAAVVDARIAGVTLEVFPASRIPHPAPPRRVWTAAIQYFLEAAALGDAVIAPNDEFALEVQRLALDRGLEPGRDFMLAGFDNLAEARAAGLTSVHPPYTEMAKEAARILANAIERNEINQESRLRPVLVPRKSTRVLKELVR